MSAYATRYGTRWHTSRDCPALSGSSEVSAVDPAEHGRRRCSACGYDDVPTLEGDR